MIFIDLRVHILQLPKMINIFRIILQYFFKVITCNPERHMMSPFSQSLIHNHISPLNS